MNLTAVKRITGFGAIIVFILFAATAWYTAKSAPLLHHYSPIDDSYMFIRYADNILAGYGIVWNKGDMPAYGTSSMTYLGVVTLGRFFFYDPDFLLQGLSWGFSVVFVCVLAVVIKGACHTNLMKKTYFVLFLTASFIFTSSSFLFHSLSGMETTLSLLFNTILIGSVMHLMRSSSWKSSLVVALVGLLCYESHPDTGLYAVLFPTLSICLLGRRENRLTTLISYLGFFFIFLALVLILKNYTLGSPVPLAFYVKKSGFYEGYIGNQNWNGAAFLLEFLQQIFPFLAILIFTSQKQHWRMLIVYLLPLFVHIIYLLTVLQITGNHGRYYFPGLPFIIVPSMITLDTFLAEYQKNISIFRIWFFQRVLLLGVLVIALSILFGEKVVGAYRIYVLEAIDRANLKITKINHISSMSWSDSLVAMSKLVKSLPSGSVIAMSEVGYIGAIAPQVQIIDIAGLNDNITAQQGFSLKRLLDRKPDLIWFPHYHYTKLVSILLNSEELRSQYEIYPNAFDYGIAIRKDSPYRQQILGQLEKDASLKR